jgi:hypothetical protein
MWVLFGAMILGLVHLTAASHLQLEYRDARPCDVHGRYRLAMNGPTPP